MAVLVGKKFLKTTYYHTENESKGKLRRVLTNLQVGVLDVPSVDAYKHEKVVKAEQNFVLTKRLAACYEASYKISSKVAEVTIVAITTLCVVSAAGLILAFIGESAQLIFGQNLFGFGLLYYPFLALLGGAAALVCALVFTVMASKEFVKLERNIQERADLNPRIRWRLTSLREYQRLENAPKVPKAVLALIDEIKEQEPNLRVLIEYTQPIEFVEFQKLASTSFMLDPIVWIKLGKERFGISVFDERGSEIPYQWL